ncbi:hypothetical protein [Acinetobacter sp. GXMZU3951]|jgi:hypothetical protein
MLKKILLVLLILSPTAIYLYIVSKNDQPSTPDVAQPKAAHDPYQTPEH